MSSTSTIALTFLFLVDFLDLYYLSLLGLQAVTAAIGYATIIYFFSVSIAIGLSIAMSALVAKSTGQGRFTVAKLLVTNISIVAIFVSILIAMLMWFNIVNLLSMVGAKGEALSLARDYLAILLPVIPVMTLAMSLGASLRAVGDGKLSMLSTMIGSIVNAVIDPLFIFTLEMGIEGAAIATVISHFIVLGIAIHGVHIKHKLFANFDFQVFKGDLKDIVAIALPAILTNIATPIGTAYISYEIAGAGDDSIIGFSAVSRIIPIAFAMIFAMSGAIGPIIGQNYGAGLMCRVKESLKSALLFCCIYVSICSLILFFLQDYIITFFDLADDSANVVALFCNMLAITFIFNGMMFIANAVFNNLGKPKYSMFFNIAKATIGTIPFVFFGAQVAGVEGILIGQALGSIFFGIVTVVIAFYLIESETKNIAI